MLLRLDADRTRDSTDAVADTAWQAADLAAPPKQELHRALSDIEESIAELDYYRKNAFKDPGA